MVSAPLNYSDESKQQLKSRLRSAPSYSQMPLPPTPSPGSVHAVPYTVRKIGCGENMIQTQLYSAVINLIDNNTEGGKDKDKGTAT